MSHGKRASEFGFFYGAAGMTRGIHTLPNQGQTQEWLSPPEIIKALGPFDLDPCAPVNRPWKIAKRHYTIKDDGLSKPWSGRVWLNPPYSAAACMEWLERLADHRNGIALIAARTETEWFHQQVWGRASGILFLRGRLHYYRTDGTRAKGNAGHGSVLAAYGGECGSLLFNKAFDGGLFEGVYLRQSVND